MIGKLWMLLLRIFDFIAVSYPHQPSHFIDQRFIFWAIDNFYFALDQIRVTKLDKGYFVQLIGIFKRDVGSLLHRLNALLIGAIHDYTMRGMLITCIKFMDFGHNIIESKFGLFEGSNHIEIR